MIGTMISHYRILEEIGRGGMGIVYKAEDTRLNRFVAIKSLPRQFSAGDEEVTRFKTEAQAAAALNHPNIATIYSVEEMKGETFIIMEYIEGEELRAIIKRGGQPGFSIAQVVSYAMQIAEGLRAAHEKGIVHRDIKSSNIMITPAGLVKVMDFGLAKVRGRALVTQAGSTLGTAAYMSPEQARGDDVDHRADIWSFGVVLYEMLTRQLPFKGEFEQAVIHSVLNEEPGSVTAIRSDVPDKLAVIVRTCLMKDPSKRYSSAAALLEDFAVVRGGDSTTAGAATLASMMRRPTVAVPAVLVVIALAVMAVWWWHRSEEAARARRELLPRIQSLVTDIPWTAEGPKSWAAFDIGTEAGEIIPDDPLYTSLKPKYSRPIHVFSDPPGALLYARPYGDSAHAWRSFGRTPIQSVDFPQGFSEARMEANGYRTTSDIIWNSIFGTDTVRIVLAPLGGIPDDMELAAGKAGELDAGGPAGLHMPGLEQVQPVALGDFLMDRYEVTNAAYKRFIAAGGYQNSAFWKEPVMSNSRAMNWESAIALFKDKTGLPGPSTWEAGTYPKGEDDYPVTGVSWYEAAAYCAFVGKSLPTIFQWDRAACTWASPAIVPLSNIAGKDPMPVGRSKSMNRFGIYDMAGNAREWCYNASGRGERFILGGGWTDAAYSFNDAYAQAPLDRSETNGIRCVREVKGESRPPASEAVITLPFRDFLKEKRVNDATFNLLVRQYSYDRRPLNPKIEATSEAADWTRQKISFTAAYGEERMTIYLFLPRGGKAPYQPVIYFPGSGALHTRSSEDIAPGPRDFLLTGGRAFIFPVYKSTYERGDALTSDYPDSTNLWKDHVIMWSKDFSRTIDYLETRKDIDAGKVAYFGASWGGAMGGIVPAVEPRIKAVVLLVAGILFQRALPEAEPLNFLPRIKAPVLMLNGKYDFFFPYETAQVPFYELLGTPKKDKKLCVFDRGHTVPRTEMIRESLAWLDRYLGPVGK
jgi:predicted Ser/Thr protein kinase/dienelactone hydrolase